MHRVAHGRLLVRLGADPYFVNHNHETALYAAAAAGHVQVVQQLVAVAPVRPGRLGTMVRQPAAYAIPDLAGALLMSIQATATIATATMATPLHAAAIAGNEAIASTLQRTGAPVNAADSDGTLGTNRLHAHGWE